jgi:2-polyprenyl-3-methyl-5-hydroxy-6-metoxy-1,4-benzoquinol methylase
MRSVNSSSKNGNLKKSILLSNCPFEISDRIMTHSRDPALLAKIRQQFDNCPYPRVPIEQSYENDLDFLYLHNFITPYYRRNHCLTTTNNRLILDAGCGSGYNTLGLAQANPGATIVGIDLSKESIKLARERLKYHKFNDVEFHVLKVEEIHRLNYQFDYIDCDEVLYLTPDPLATLKAMKGVLKPEGILRVNLHSRHGRVHVFQMQEVFQRLGLMAGEIGELEIGAVREILDALKETVRSKQIVWGNGSGAVGRDDASILANFLLVGDRGFDVGEMFAYLRQAELEFISMVEWWNWDFLNLFQEPDNLPVVLGLSLPDASIEECLALHELLHPQRLIDLWCGHPQQGQVRLSPSEWGEQEWLRGTVNLHPQLKIPEFAMAVKQCLTHGQPLPIGKFLPQVGGMKAIDNKIVAGLLPPLLESPQSVKALVERWLQLNPLDPLTMQPMQREQIFPAIARVLMELEACRFLLLESGN